MAWEARQIGKQIMEGILTDVVKFKTMGMIKNIVMEMVDASERDGKTKMIFSEILHYGLAEKIKECIRAEEKKKRLLRKMIMEKD